MAGAGKQAEVGRRANEIRAELNRARWELDRPGDPRARARALATRPSFRTRVTPAVATPLCQQRCDSRRSGSSPPSPEDASEATTVERIPVRIAQDEPSAISIRDALGAGVPSRSRSSAASCRRDARAARSARGPPALATSLPALTPGDRGSGLRRRKRTGKSREQSRRHLTTPASTSCGGQAHGQEHLAVPPDRTAASGRESRASLAPSLRV